MGNPRFEFLQERSPRVFSASRNLVCVVEGGTREIVTSLTAAADEALRFLGPDAPLWGR